MFAGYNVSNALKASSWGIFLAPERYGFFNPTHLWDKYREHTSDLTVRIVEKSAHTPQIEELDNFDKELMKRQNN